MGNVKAILPRLKRAWNRLTGTIPGGQDLIWWLIVREGRPWMQWISPVLFILFFGGCFWLSFRNVDAALSLGLALVMQMYLHEMGHHLIFKGLSIRSHVWWLFPLGAVAAPVDKEENEKSDRLPWWSIAWVLQGGITVNLVLMCAGMVLQRITSGWPAMFGKDLLYTGGILAITNLIPFWQLDGSLLYHVIFSSLKEDDDTRVALAVIGGMSLTGLAAFWTTGKLGLWQVIMDFVEHIGWFVALLVIATGIWHRQGMDDPAYSASKQAMTVKQAVIHILFYVAQLYLALRLVLGPI